MIRYLVIDEVLDLHRWSIQAYGGAEGVLNLGMVESAILNPSASFSGVDAYPSLFEKAAALCFSLVKNHAFADGNKRVGFAALATFLRLNHHRLICEQAAGADMVFRLADGKLSREELVSWVTEHCQPVPNDFIERPVPCAD